MRTSRRELKSKSFNERKILREDHPLHNRSLLDHLRWNAGRLILASVFMYLGILLVVIAILSFGAWEGVSAFFKWSFLVIGLCCLFAWAFLKLRAKEITQKRSLPKDFREDTSAEKEKQDKGVV